jgi:hypothetical protein
MKLVRFLFVCLFFLAHLSVAQQVNQVVVEDPSAELYFIFNQPGYTAGDTAFFKAFISGSIENSFKGNKVMNIALYKKSEKVLYQRISMREAKASGYLSFSPKIESGVYRLMVEVNGSFFEAEFIIAGERKYTHEESVQFSPAPGIVTTDIAALPFKTNMGATITIAIGGINDMSMISATVIRDDLFDQPNLVRCKIISGQVYSQAKDEFPQYFSGRVIDKQGKKIPDSTKITFYLKDNDFIYPVHTFRNGEFEFPLFKNFGSDEVFYSLTYQGQEKQDAFIELNEVFKNPASVAEGLETNVSDVYTEFTKGRRAIEKSYKFFLEEEPKDHVKGRYDITADKEVSLDRFENFPSVAELIINILPAVKYRKNSKREFVRIFLKETAQVAINDPIYIIDGIMTDSTELFLGLDPSKIKLIKILRSEETLRRYGELGRNGILVVESKVMDGLTIPRGSKTLFITGLNNNKIAFDNNNLQSSDGVMPDVRSCLYWNPDLKVNDSGNASFTFYTGEITGPVKLIVTGITSDGRLFYYEEKGLIEFERK